MQISLKHWPPLAQLQVPCGCVFCMQNTTTKVFHSFQQAKNIHLQVKTGYCSPRLLTGTAQTWVTVVALYLTLVTAVSVGTWQLEFTQERMVPCWSGVERKNRQCSLLPGCRCNVASFVVHPTLWLPRTSLSSLCRVFVTAVNTKQDWHSRQPQTDAGRESLDSWNNRGKNVKGAMHFKGAPPVT